MQNSFPYHTLFDDVVRTHSITDKFNREISIPLVGMGAAFGQREGATEQLFRRLQQALTTKAKQSGKFPFRVLLMDGGIQDRAEVPSWFTHWADSVGTTVRHERNIRFF